MRAARMFVLALRERGFLEGTRRVRCELFGSLGATGRGHGTDKAVILGLEGEEPDRIDPDCIEPALARVRSERVLRLLGQHPIAFEERTDLSFLRRETLPFHPNAMRCTALAGQEGELLQKTYYSVGGGFVVSQDATGNPALLPDPALLPYPFRSADELLSRCETNDLTIAQLMWRNELTWRPATRVQNQLLAIWQAMQACVNRGLATQGTLPGGLKVRRRAPGLYRKLIDSPEAGLRDQLTILDWVDLYAMAVNEENAAGGRVVTAPTNGAAGVVPAVLHYYHRFIPGASEQGVIDFLLTAAAIGILYKENASISGAEVGCQGEVGVACSMAAGALAAVLGGSPRQVENAAEIGMEHNLGLTCDPVGGLVQIPCIERNAMGAVKAINAARIAMRGDGSHHVSLDKVIKTMRETGADMKTKYKETSRGGLAVNVVEC